MLQGGISETDVARQVGCHLTTITRLVQRYQLTGVVAGRPRSSRPRVTTPAQGRFIRVTHPRNRTQAASRTAALVQGPRGPVSTDIIRRRLRDGGLHCRRPYVRPILTRQHRRRRLQWTRQHQRWRRAQWRQVFFSDESRFHLSHADGRLREFSVDVMNVTRIAVSYRQTDGGGGSVMVWGAFSYNHRPQLHVF